MINRNPNYYSEGSSERRIQEVLVPLVKELKEIMFTQDFKNSPGFNTEQTELLVLGSIISKYCEWSGGRIEQVCTLAFEDSNFNNTKIIYL